MVWQDQPVWMNLSLNLTRFFNSLVSPPMTTLVAFVWAFQPLFDALKYQDPLHTLLEYMAEVSTSVRPSRLRIPL